jgi:hypothetical protein
VPSFVLMIFRALYGRYAIYQRSLPSLIRTSTAASQIWLVS